MQNQKLKLDELKVQSFVTDFDQEQGQTQEVNGGTGRPYCLDASQLVYCLGPRLTITRNISCLAATCNYALCSPEIPTRIPTDFTTPPTTYNGGLIGF